MLLVSFNMHGSLFENLHSEAIVNLFNAGKVAAGSSNGVVINVTLDTHNSRCDSRVMDTIHG
jgi:hypothetical protein